MLFLCDLQFAKIKRTKFSNKLFALVLTLLASLFWVAESSAAPFKLDKHRLTQAKHTTLAQKSEGNTLVSASESSLESDGHITGTVTDEAGNPLSNIRVEARRWNGDWWAWVRDKY